MWDDFYIVYVFRKGNKHYLVPAQSEEQAWDDLQQKLSWNMKLVKQRCSLIYEIKSTSQIVKIG